MSRVNESTPLLVNDKIQSRPQHRRSVWQFVLAGALSLGVFSLFQQQQQQNSIPWNIPDVTVSFNEEKTIPDDASDVAFLSRMETFKDPLVDPCVDFYEYACGGWFQHHEIPSDRPSIDSSFYVVSEHNKDIIQHIFDQYPPQVGPFYHSCLSDEEVDANAIAFVTHLINNVHQAKSILALMNLAGEMDQSLGISTFFSRIVDADPQDPTTNVLKLSQGGLTLPSREYYLEQNKVDAYAALYVDYVAKLFAVGGLDHDSVSEFAESVLEIETTFANISLPNAALRDPKTTNMAYPFAEIAQKYPFLMAYLNGIYKKEPFPMLHAIIATPDFFEAQNQILSNEALLPQLKKYLSFHLIDSLGTFLGEYFRRVHHDFHGKVQGAGNLLPRNQFCIRMTTTFLGDEVGKYYMQDVLDPDAKNAAESLVAEIEESLKELLSTETWMDKITYDAAVEKLNKVKNYIGGPDDVPPLPFELQADAFFDNVKRLLQLDAAEMIHSVGKRVDEKAWNMFASTVNAYYDPSANKIVFPAAILQPPFYNAEHFPAAANFARIGMLMGHELSHGFDDQGRNYDGNGAIRSWWTPSVSTKFTEKAECLAAQYSAFPVVSIQDGRVLGNVNGNLTLGENIADNGGIRLAYEAYHRWKSTFTPPPIVPSSKILPETPNPNPAAPSPPNEQASESAPSVRSKEIPAAPVVPTPAPIEPGPGKPNSVTTFPPSVLPVPDTETPIEPQTGSDGETPGASPPRPTVVPESQPTDIPHESSPIPELPTPVEKLPATLGQEAATKAPTVTPISSTPPPDLPSTSPMLPTVPTPSTPPNGSPPPTLPDVPDTPSPSNTPATSQVPSVVPQPRPSVVSPDTTNKHQHKNEEEEPSAEPKKKDHTEIQKHHESRSEKSGKPNDSEGENDVHDDHDSKHERNDDHDHHRNKEKGDRLGDYHHKRLHHSHKVNEHDTKKGKKDHHAKRSSEDDGESDKSMHSKHESKNERREDHKNEKKKIRHHENEKHHHHHDKVYQEDHESRHREKHHHHEECGDCEQKKHHGHHYKLEEDKDTPRHGCGKGETDCGSKRHKWTLSASNYPFSGGDARIESVVKKLARAFAQPNDSVEDDRLFFTAFAQNWCEKRTPGYAELLRTIDTHSPGKWRVNGPLMNYAKFAAVFSCPVGTPMNPEKKCVVW